MKWFLGLLLTVALLGAAAYGVGRFLLPNTLEVTRSVSIERPRAALFAMVYDLNIAKEWSPYYARDPDAEFTFSGSPSGPGQSMRWVSNVRAVGRGSMSIVGARENEEVVAIIQRGERATRATFDSRIRLQRTATGSQVSWTVTAACTEGWRNIPCRYMNRLILPNLLGTTLAEGLARLKNLAEQLPPVDFEGLEPQFEIREAQPFIYSVIETSSNPEEVARAEQIGLNQVRQFMSEYNLTPAGPLTRVEISRDQERLTYYVGYPYSGARPVTVVGVRLGETPSGRVMHALVEGNRLSVQAVMAQMEAYLQAKRIARREGALPWHVVHNAGSADSPAQVQIFIPLD